MDVPDWAEILRVLYRDEPPHVSLENGGEKEVFTTRWLAGQTSLSKERVDSTTANMKEWELVVKKGLRIEGVEGPDASVALTKDGFEVAHERELSERNNRINQSLASFTLVLVVITGVGVVPIWEVRAVAVAMLLIAVVYFANQADIFDL